MRMLDLFSGIGGFSLAASWAGIETVAFCEQDAYCTLCISCHATHHHHARRVGLTIAGKMESRARAKESKTGLHG
jgi:site-specific DNA-cytosine methylase